MSTNKNKNSNWTRGEKKDTHNLRENQFSLLQGSTRLYRNIHLTHSLSPFFRDFFLFAILNLYSICTHQHYVLMGERRVPFKAKIYWSFHHTLSHVRTILKVIIICVSFFHFYFAVCEWVYVVDYCSCLPLWYRNAKNQFCVRTCSLIVECVEAKNLVMILFSLVYLQQYHLLHAKTYPPSTPPSLLYFSLIVIEKT